MSSGNATIDECSLMPKLELHAHLNGSISNHVIEKLSKKKLTDDDLQKDVQYLMQNKGKLMNYEKVFRKFGIIHKLVDDIEAVHMTTCDVVSEFAAENVRYLELRSTPKHTQHMTRRQYVQAMMSAINSAHEGTGCITKALLSIDRKNDLAVAMETVNLATEFRDQGVVGIDLSGHPEARDALHFLPALEEARKRGLKLAIHLTEFSGMGNESEQLLNLCPPDRIGHGIYLHENEASESYVQRNKIPIEICVTSNLVCQVVPNMESHPVTKWVERKHPILISTDDSGVFETNSSREHQLVAQCCGLTARDLHHITYNGINHIFADESTKSLLQNDWMLKT